ncbi:hypothetical protein KSZ_05050 [Dictyobacter formicarum]|uniref:Uncharacterized protein n=1 Tax=Dictyobacter formicarum TaxID=2778368 RepID=A0ABQ3V952_9CHLR|nr:hypothetical protein KSZ_05050 [Dictyobacter formicarum]
MQTATVVGEAYGIHRTTLAQAAKAGVLGSSAYRSGDAWLIKTDHPDFWAWLRGHEYHPCVKGYRKQQAAQAAHQGLLLEQEGDEATTERLGQDPDAPSPGGDVLEDGMRRVEQTAGLETADLAPPVSTDGEDLSVMDVSAVCQRNGM